MRANGLERGSRDDDLSKLARREWDAKSGSSLSSEELWSLVDFFRLLDKWDRDAEDQAKHM